jgi:secreted trypsin-like serine protease
MRLVPLWFTIAAADRGLHNSQPTGGRAPTVNDGSIVFDADPDKQTWNQDTGKVNAEDSATREKGHLKPGYWCDQRSPSTDVMHVDSANFLLERGLFTRTTGLEGRMGGPSSNGNGDSKTDDDRMTFFDRIIGGENAQEHSWSFIAYFYGCGATLVAKNWALTAAHCCTIPAWYFKDKDLCFGRDYKNGKNASPESKLLEQCAGIAEIIQHPNYDRSETVLNDICLLKLKTDVQYNNHVQPACLPDLGQSLGDHLVVPGGQEQAINCYVAGWGYRQENKWTSLPDILQDAQVNLFKNETCEEAYTETDKHGKVMEYYRRDVMSCFGHEEGGIDACQGDSGGPLICIEESPRVEMWTNNGVYTKHFNPVLRGIVSWGEGCARKGKPGVYARTSAYTSWIHETIRDHATSSTSGGCPDLKKYYQVDEGVLYTCGSSGCDLSCENDNYVPVVDRVTCSNKRWSPPLFQLPRLACAPTANMFTACGALSSNIDVRDVDKLTFDCTKKMCRIGVRDAYKATCEPSVTLVKCMKGEYTYPYKVIGCEPKFSTTSKCGPILQKFPYLLRENITPKCVGVTCTLSNPKAATISPVSATKCQRGAYQLPNTVTKDSAGEVVFKVVAFGDVNPDYECEWFDSKLKKTMKKTLYDHMQINYQPHKLESDLEGFGGVSKPKPICITKNFPECIMYCPKMAGGVQKNGRKWKCHPSKGWLPRAWGGKISCHSVYSKDGRYEAAKEEKARAA